jgi:prepilin-type N-terminal cleavage/methylation domain-containing protein
MIANRTAVRPGFTMVEVMASLAALTIVMGVCAALITMLFNLSDSGEKHAAQELAIARAARTFRHDVHVADAVETRPSGKPSTVLSLLLKDGSSIEYTAERGSIVRVETDGVMIVTQDRLFLPEKSSPRFERHKEGDRIFLTLVFDRRGAKTDDPHAVRSFRVDAALGADSRFDRDGGTSP